MKFQKAVVIDARDLPGDVLEWCVDNEISTHYENSLTLIRRDENPETTNPLFRWLVDKGVKMEEFSDKDVFYVALIAT